MSNLEIILKWLENDSNYNKAATLLILAVLGAAAVAEAIFDKTKK